MKDAIKSECVACGADITARTGPQLRIHCANRPCIDARRAQTTCSHCAGPIPTVRAKGAAPWGYCSKVCYFGARPTVAGDCLTCGKPLPYKVRRKMPYPGYCSRACSLRRECAMCGKVILGIHGNSSRWAQDFCSRTCAATANGMRQSMGQTGLASLTYIVKGFVATIVRTGKIACEMCGYDNPPALVVHHRDRNRRNNGRANLVTLCANCHAEEHRTGNDHGRRTAKMATWIARHPDAVKMLPE